MSLRNSFRSIALSSFFGLLAVGGCDSTSSSQAVTSSTGAETEFNPVMRAFISGSNWTATSARAVDVRVDDKVFLSVEGEAVTGDRITLLFNRPLELKTYVIRGAGLAAQQYRAPGAPASEIFASTDTGTVTFTFISEKRLEGTFSFDANRASDGAAVTIKSGSFNVGF
jgi:Family of unknown function (DUF6252)